MSELVALRRAALGELGKPLPRLRTSLLYQGALAVVGFAMVLLPLIYIAVILATAYGIYLYSFAGLSLFDGIRGRGMIIGIVLYLGPLVAGVILILFMVKPLFAAPSRVDTAVPLDPEREPFLFDYVRRLCATIGCRPPQVIQIDNQVNASASFHRGWLGIFSGNLVLTVGLPLIAGMSLRQLTGVLSHEFGHFAQAAGMRMTFVIRSVNGWFHRVVYERDAWDLWLQRNSEEADFRIGVVLYAARACVWLTRLLLTALMYLGHAISSFMLRQMEFDADRYEAHVAGSEVFEQSARRLTELNIWMHGVQADIEESRRDGRLPDNLCALLLSQEEEIPAEAVDELVKEQLERKTHWADTHPADGLRVAAARREEAPGAFLLEAPATILLRDFAREARLLTLADYERQFGIAGLAAHTVVPTEVALARRARETAARKAAERYFVGQLQALRPLTLELERSPLPATEARELLGSLRQQMEAARESYAETFERYDLADTARLDAHRGEVLLQANYRLEPGQFGLQGSMPGDAIACIAELRGNLRSLASELSAFEALATRRLELALGLFLSDPGLQARMDDGAEALRRVEQLVPLTRTTSELNEAILDLQERFAAAVVLFQQLQAGTADETVYSVLRNRVITLSQKLDAFRAELGDQPYPFAAAPGEESQGTDLESFLFPDRPAEDEIVEVLQLCGNLLDKIIPLNYRAVSRLAEVAERVEQALDLEPAPEADPTP